MSGVFLRVVNMSISGGWLILAVLLLRLFLGRAPKWVSILLWGIAAVRLICPFLLESTLSLIPSAETIPPSVLSSTAPVIHMGIPMVNSAVNPIVRDSLAPTPGDSADPLQILIPIFSALWLAGIAVMLMYAVISVLRLRKRLETAVLLRENILQSEFIPAPFVLGFFRPRIYLPFGLELSAMAHVIAHETAHIQRKDHWWKLLGYLLLSLHWFNPLVWLAYSLLCRDIELACDERVIRGLNNEDRAEYSRALLSCSISRRSIAACPLAFGEVGAKARVKSVLRYKKPAILVTVLALAVCTVTAVCFLTNPADSTKEPDLSFLHYENAASLVADRESITVIYCPPDVGEIRIGSTSGSALAAYLDSCEWTACRKPSRSLYSPGSVEFVISDDHRITVHDRKDGSLLRYAVVQYGDELRYYRTGRRDYDTALSIVGAPSVPPTVTKWFDYTEDPAALPWDSSVTAELEAFPHVIFSASSGEIRAEANGESTALIYGMPIWSCYFTDLTGDDLPDLCAELSMGSGVIDQRIVICDYANGASYELSARGAYDFSLRYDEDDGYLHVEKRDHRTHELIAEGRLIYTDGCITAEFPEEEEQYGAALSVTVNTDTDPLSQAFFPAGYPEGFDWDYGALPSGTIADEGTLIFDAAWDTDTLVISEDYYHDYGDTGYIEKETYTLTRNSSGQFELEASHRGENPEYAVYFIQGETGVYVMKIFFGAMDEPAVG